jgi:hypothetical protein
MDKKQSLPLAITKIAFTVAIGVITYKYLLGGGVETQVESDALTKANIAIKAGDWDTACFQTQIASSAALETKQINAYNNAKEAEVKVCEAAELERMKKVRQEIKNLDNL